MNIALWILQVLLAIHTLMGAIWKLSNPEQTVPSLSAIPHGAWLALSVLEMLCSLALFLPVIHKPLGSLVPIAAGFVAVEMLLFSLVHLASGETSHGPMIYWLVVGALCSGLAYGRFVLKPL